nr:receptor-interacting serine/threonine-protein kinase 4-like [Ziziphus jujuba var. spinosa]
MAESSSTTASVQATKDYMYVSGLMDQRIVSGSTIIIAKNTPKMEKEIRPQEDDITQLYEASQRGCVSTLKALIHKDPLLNKLSLTSFGETPLHISALLGHLAFTQILITLRPKLASGLDTFKRTPLHLAAAEGHTEIVEELLKVNHHVCRIRDQEGEFLSVMQ